MGLTRTRPIRFTGRGTTGPITTYCRKFAYQSDASRYKNEVGEHSEWAFFGKHGGFWVVVYAREAPYKNGDIPAVEGVDY